MASQKNISDSSYQLMNFDIPEIISGYLAELPKNQDFSRKSSKLDFHHCLLGEGVEKIDAFKSIETNEEKLQREEKVQVTEELMPRESYLDRNKRLKSSFDLSEKKKWMRSFKLCTTPIQCENNSDTGNHNSILSIKSSHDEDDHGIEIGIKKNVLVEEESSLSILMAEVDATNWHLKEFSAVIYQAQPHRRKQRRRWSKELKDQFGNALTQLGGPHSATPMSILDIMKVDGLTNIEVKSHLQKYRLRLKKESAKSVANDNMEDNGDDETEASTSKSRIPNNCA